MSSLHPNPSWVEKLLHQGENPRATKKTPTAAEGFCKEKKEFLVTVAVTM